MAFDYKKEYKEFYLPPKKPGIIDVPEMNYVAVRGRGNPNEPEGEYQAAMGILYGIAFTIKMSERAGHAIEGYFSYVVPPLEGLWRQRKETGEIRGAGAFDYGKKDELEWISMIRLPEFVTREVFDWAVREAEEKNRRIFQKRNFSPGMKGCVYSVCTWEPMTTNRIRSDGWENMPENRGMRWMRRVRKTDRKRSLNGREVGRMGWRFYVATMRSI